MHTVYYEVELSCLMCGRALNEKPVRLSHPHQRFFAPPCTFCGGRPVTSSMKTVHDYGDDVPGAWPPIKARVGRPPKWLIREREMIAARDLAEEVRLLAEM